MPCKGSLHIFHGIRHTRQTTATTDRAGSSSSAPIAFCIHALRYFWWCVRATVALLLICSRSATRFHFIIRCTFVVIASLSSNWKFEPFCFVMTHVKYYFYFFAAATAAAVATAVSHPYYFFLISYFIIITCLLLLFSFGFLFQPFFPGAHSKRNYSSARNGTMLGELKRHTHTESNRVMFFCFIFYAKYTMRTVYPDGMRHKSTFQHAKLAVSPWSRHRANIHLFSDSDTHLCWIAFFSSLSCIFHRHRRYRCCLRVTSMRWSEGTTNRPNNSKLKNAPLDVNEVCRMHVLKFEYNFHFEKKELVVWALCLMAHT